MPRQKAIIVVKPHGIELFSPLADGAAQSNPSNCILALNEIKMTRGALKPLPDDSGADSRFAAPQHPAMNTRKGFQRL
jgi:hypothetical protein